MSNWLTYELSTGRILQRSSEQLADPGPGMSQIESAGRPFSHYVTSSSPRAVLERSPLNATWDKVAIDADGIDTATLSGLPVPCDVSLDGEVHTISDGTFELSVTSPGTYIVIVSEVEFLEQQWSITGD